MIGIKLWGGLGNQLFQYAFGLYLSDKRKEKVYYYGEILKENNLDLNYFNVTIDILSQEVETNNGCSSLQIPVILTTQFQFKVTT